MRSTRLTFLMCVAVASLAGLLGAAPAAPAPAPPAAVSPPPHIAVVNPAKIFKDMKETKALSEGLEARRKELLAKEMEKRNAIEALMKQRSDTLPTNHLYRELSDQIDAAKADFQAWGVSTKASVERDQKYMVRDLYVKIEAGIAEVAQRNNIDIVLPDNRQDISNIEEIPADELRRMLGSRSPLYASKSSDISEAVITELDKKFLEEKK